jgi:hypothetical protein
VLSQKINCETSSEKRKIIMSLNGTLLEQLGNTLSHYSNVTGLTDWVVKPAADYVVTPLISAAVSHPYVAAVTTAGAAGLGAYATVPSFRQATNRRLADAKKFITDHAPALPSMPSFRRYAQPTKPTETQTDTTDKNKEPEKPQTGIKNNQ